MRRDVLAFCLFVALTSTLVAPGCGGTRTVTKTVTAAGTTQGAPRQMVLYGHIKSLKRKDGRFELRFDPALWLNGVAAEHAALEDTGSSEVPNDYYILELGHRLLTYVVSETAHVTVLTSNGVGSIPVTAITVSELAQIVNGKNPKHFHLMEPKAGYWIRVGDKYPNAVLSLDQQYQP